LITNVFRTVAPPAAAVDQEYASKTLGDFSRGGGGGGEEEEESESVLSSSR
jgi:hypothetical protein